MLWPTPLPRCSASRLIGIVATCLLALCSLAIAAQAGAGSYTLLSLDGKPARIVVLDDFDTRALLICCNKDTQRLGLDWYGHRAEMQTDSHFLKIICFGGPGGTFNDQILLCVDRGRLYQALHIMCQTRFMSDNNIDEWSNSIGAAKGKADRTSLVLSLHRFRQWDGVIKTDYHKAVKLRFDSGAHAFCTGYSTMNATRTTIYLANNKTVKRRFKGKLPVIHIDTQAYLLRHGIWYRNFEAFPADRDKKHGQNKLYHAQL